jgi:hypothetical protein
MPRGSFLSYRPSKSVHQERPGVLVYQWSLEKKFNPLPFLTSLSDPVETSQEYVPRYPLNVYQISAFYLYYEKSFINSDR